MIKKIFRVTSFFICCFITIFLDASPATVNYQTYNYEIDGAKHTINTGESIDFIVDKMYASGIGRIECLITDMRTGKRPPNIILFEGVGLSWGGSTNPTQEKTYSLDQDSHGFILELMNPQLYPNMNSANLFFINQSTHPNALTQISCAPYRS